MDIDRPCRVEGGEVSQVRHQAGSTIAEVSQSRRGFPDRLMLIRVFLLLCVGWQEDEALAHAANEYRHSAWEEVCSIGISWVRVSRLG